MNVHHSSQKQDWETPESLLVLVRKLGPIELDPATTKKNPTKAKKIFTPKEDGLKRAWRADGLVYVNPPYSGLKKKGGWADKITSYPGECLVLLPARPGSAWFEKFCDWADWILFLKKRLVFKGAKNSAPFPSMLAYRGPGPFLDIFGPLGQLMPGTRTYERLLKNV